MNGSVLAVVFHWQIKKTRQRPAKLSVFLNRGDRSWSGRSKSVSINQPLAVDALPLNLTAEGASVSVTMLARESSLFSETNESRTSDNIVTGIEVVELYLPVVGLV